ncbi:MAG: cell division protein ZapA [Flavobacteriales bacterium]
MSKKNVKIKIGDRVYPLTVSESEETSVELSAEKIAENIKKLKNQYKITDSQDLLAMTCLEFANKIQSAQSKPEPVEVNNNSAKLDELLLKLNQELS